MGILAWIVFGLLAGIVARIVIPGPDPSGIMTSILLGVAGAVVGGLIGSALGMGGVTEFNIGSFLLAVAGSVLLLLIYRRTRRT